MTRVVLQILVGRNDEPFLRYALRSTAWVDAVTVCVLEPAHPISKENLRVVREEVPRERLVVASSDRDDAGRISFADARNQTLMLMEPDDFALILDADDVHYPEWESIVRTAVSEGIDSLSASFYHLMVHPDRYQFVAQREVGFRVRESSFEGAVHETLITPREHPRVSDYRYVHYGYVKPQAAVLARWRLYAELEDDACRYDSVDPEHILDDRLPTCLAFEIPHPPAVAGFIESDYLGHG